MKGLMNKLAMSCKQASLLAAKQSFERLSFLEKVKLKMHTSMCDACKTFGQESQLIDEAIVKILQQKEKQVVKLTEEQRLRIIEALK